MKQIAIVVIALGVLALAAQKSASNRSAIVHQTASGKFIQVGSTYYSSGIAARLPDGKVPEGMTAQTRVTLEKFAKAYEEMGLKMSDVVKVNVYITDEKLKSQMNEEYGKVFPSKTAPCRTAVTVAGLDSGRLVEMEMIAVKQ